MIEIPWTPKPKGAAQVVAPPAGIVARLLHDRAAADDREAPERFANTKMLGFYSFGALECWL